MNKFFSSLFLALCLTLASSSIAKADSVFQFNTTALPSVTVNNTYSASINFLYNGTGAISVNESGFPPGISAKSPSLVSENNYSILLSGTPTQAGDFIISVSLSNQDNSSLVQSFPITITATDPINSSLFGIKIYPFASADIGYDYNNDVFFNYFGSSTPIASFSNLPPGLTPTRPIMLAPQDHPVYNYEVILEGAPTVPGNYDVSLKLTDGVITNNYDLGNLNVYGTYSPTIIPTTTTSTTLPLTDSAGTNIIANGTVYMITADGQRRPYTSAGAFLSYGFNSWTTVLPASAADLELPISTNFIPPRDGKIICSDRGIDKGTCYLITNSQKAGFTSEKIFKDLGFSFNQSLNGDISFLPSTDNINNSNQAHATGVLINKSGTVYLVGNNGLLGIPDMNTLNSWGFVLSDVVKANAADSLKVQTGIMQTHMPGALSPL